MSGPPNMPEVDWRATAQQVGKKLRRAERVLRMCYRKHCLDDESVGWNELTDSLCTILAEFMGDREFQRWSENPQSRDQEDRS